MSDETREAVARAIVAATANASGGAIHGDFDLLFPNIRDAYREIAGTALAALRPGSRFTVEGVECVVVPVAPTPEMVLELAGADISPVDGRSPEAIEWIGWRMGLARQIIRRQRVMDALGVKPD